VVERWVTQEEYRALFEQRKLAWQVSYEEEEREKERLRQEESKGDQSMEDVTSIVSRDSPLITLLYVCAKITLLDHSLVNRKNKDCTIRKEQTRLSVLTLLSHPAFSLHLPRPHPSLLSFLHRRKVSPPQLPMAPSRHFRKEDVSDYLRRKGSKVQLGELGRLRSELAQSCCRRKRNKRRKRKRRV